MSPPPPPCARPMKEAEEEEREEEEGKNSKPQPHQPPLAATATAEASSRADLITAAAAAAPLAAASAVLSSTSSGHRRSENSMAMSPSDEQFEGRELASPPPPPPPSILADLDAAPEWTPTVTSTPSPHSSACDGSSRAWSPHPGRDVAVAAASKSAQGTPASASAAEVKRSYRELMKEMHPDASAGAGGPDSTELATLLNEIYRVSVFSSCFSG